MMLKTTSLETSKLLKEAGFKQEGIECIWAEFYNTSSNVPTTLLSSLLGVEELEDFKERNYLKDVKFFAAPTTDELLEELPKDGSISILPWMDEGAYGRYEKEVFCGYAVWYRGFQEKKQHNRPFKNTDLCESLAQCWLWLKKENLLSKEAGE